MQQLTQALKPSRTIPAHRLHENALVWHKDCIYKVRRVRSAETRTGLHVHLVPADWQPIDGPTAIAHEMAALTRVPCGLKHPWELVLESDLSQTELEEELVIQAQAIAPECRSCFWFCKSQSVGGVGYCVQHEGAMRACDQPCASYKEAKF